MADRQPESSDAGTTVAATADLLQLLQKETQKATKKAVKKCSVGATTFAAGQATTMGPTELVTRGGEELSSKKDDEEPPNKSNPMAELVTCMLLVAGIISSTIFGFMLLLVVYKIGPYQRPPTNGTKPR